MSVDGMGATLEASGRGTRPRLLRAGGSMLLAAAMLAASAHVLVPAPAIAGQANSPPVAVDDPGATCGPPMWGGSFPIPEDWPEPFGFGFGCRLLANDTDPDGDHLTIAVVTPPAHGSYEVFDNPSIDLVYQPDPDYSTIAGDEPGGTWLSDSLTYVANDGMADSNEATMRLWIAPINDPPSFTPGPSVVQMGESSGPYSQQWVVPGSMAAGPPNESGQSVTFEIVHVDVNGVPGLFVVDPAIDASGVLTFTPGAGQVGLAEVTLRAVDDGGLEDYQVVHPGLPIPDDTSDSVQFSIVVNDVENTPVAVAASVTTDEDAAIQFDLVATDSDGDLAILASNPADGTLNTVGSPSCVSTTCTQTVAYMPDADFAGSDSFTFVASDGTLLSDPATVAITVDAVNDAPGFTAGNDPEVNEDGGAFSGPWATAISAGPNNESAQTVSFQITANDNASLFGVAPAVAANGTLTFTPAANRHGVAHLTVKAVDTGGTVNGGQNTSGASTLTITVDSVNDPPAAVNDMNLFVAYGSPGQVLDVLANDTWLPDDSETLHIAAVTQGAHGTVLITNGGTRITYVPDPAFHGSDTFGYTIEDPGGLSDAATVEVDVGPDVTAPTVIAPRQVIRTSVQLGTSTLEARLTWSGSDAGGLDHFVLQRSVKGGAYQPVALTSPTSTATNISLTFGSSYRFRVQAVDQSGNASAWAYGPTLTPSRYQEASSQVTYVGRWIRTSGAKHSGGYVKHANVAGRSATFTRALRDVAFVAPTSSRRGTADIYLDGVKVASINLKSSSIHQRRVIWTAHFDTLAVHVVRVVVTGSRRVDVDCFAALR